MTQPKISSEELALMVWSAASAHAETVHDGGADQECHACTVLYDAIGEIEASLYPQEPEDGRTAPSG